MKESGTANTYRVMTGGTGSRILKQTLGLLHTLYLEAHVRPGRLLRIGIKPQWITMMGTQGECGIAVNPVKAGALPFYDTDPSLPGLRTLINKPLFEIAEEGIHSADLQKRSLGIAAMSALSQQFIGCSAVRKRGYLAQCWRADDKLAREYPAILQLIKPDDVVALAGDWSLTRDLVGRCRQLHVTNIRDPENFKTVIIDGIISEGPKDIRVHPEKETAEVVGDADVVVISPSALVTGTFDELMRYTKRARLIGIHGPGASLLPDVFFEQGIRFISSYRIVDPARFAYDLHSEHDMEYSLRTAQKQYLIMHPNANAPRWMVHSYPRATAHP
jgi:uncharacterized protein (DUF4213/DUF364 family)